MSLGRGDMSPYSGVTNVAKIPEMVAKLLQQRDRGVCVSEGEVAVGVFAGGGAEGDG